MRLLLDTHVFLWWVAADARLTRTARAVIEDPANDVFVSAVVAWEIEIKRRLGKLNFEGEVEMAVADEDFEALSVTMRHTAETGRLPMLHHDPFDRLLIAQARVEAMTLVTADPRVMSYPVSAMS